MLIEILRFSVDGYRLYFCTVDSQSTASHEASTEAAPTTASIDWSQGPWASETTGGYNVLSRLCGGYVFVEGLSQPQEGPVGEEVRAVFKLLQGRVLVCDSFQIVQDTQTLHWETWALSLIHI